MTSANKTYIVGGLVLALAGLVFGLWYAIFDEHQTLEGMGAAFAQSFFEAADRNEAGVDESLATLGSHSYDYLREVSVHAHIIELGTLALLVPLFAHRLAWKEGTKLLLARAFIAGSVVFCLGVYLQILTPGTWTQALAVIGSGVVIACVGALTHGVIKGAAAA